MAQTLLLSGCLLTCAQCPAPAGLPANVCCNMPIVFFESTPMTPCFLLGGRSLARWLALLPLMVWAPGAAFAQALPPTAVVGLGQMPVIQAQTLAQQKLVLPQDLPADKTLALIAFEREQQANVNTWIEGLGLNTATEPWVELPVVGPQGSFMRAVIDNGMRMGIRDEAMRRRVITLYTDREAFVQAMGLPNGMRTIYAAIIHRSGQVLAVVPGDYTPEKAAVLAQAHAN